MNADSMGDDLDDWVDRLVARVEESVDGIALADAVVELRASSIGRGLQDFDDDDLADMIDESLSMIEGIGLLAKRDQNYELVDPSRAQIKTSAAIVHGRKLSHRITAQNVIDRQLPFDLVLGALDSDLLYSDALYDSQGNALDRFASGSHGVRVPTFVEDFVEGRLAVVWRQGDALHFDVIDDDDLEADGAQELAMLLDHFASQTAAGVGGELTMNLFYVITENAEAFTRTTPPVDELLLANGFVERRGWWGPGDQDWETPGVQRRARRIAMAAERYGLRSNAEQALARLDDNWHAWSGYHTFGVGDSPQLDVREMCDLFEIELVPLAFFDLQGAESALMMNARGDEDDATALSLLASEVSQSAPDSLAALLLTAWDHETAGRAGEADRAYREALRCHETNATALVRSMEAAVDASRFDEALRLTQRLMGPGSPNEDTLRSYVDAMITAGRNDPCPCGSGRKYKQCHQGVPLLLEPDATRALIFKLEMFAEKMAMRDDFAPGANNGLVAELIGYPEARDFIVHEGGMLDRFLADRLDLIPSGELERLRSWQMGARGLYEITAVDPGQGMTLRDVATGEYTEIVERLGSAGAQIGQYVLLRLETIDGVTTSYGQGVFVPASDCAYVLDVLDFGAVDELLEWFARRLSPPSLATTDGDALVSTTGVISTTASVDGVQTLLDGEFGAGWPDDVTAQDRQWTATRDGSTGEGSTVLATMRIVDGSVELSTMSEKRHERFVDELLELLPGAELVDENVEPLDLRALASMTDGLSTADDLQIDQDVPDEIQAVLDKHILQMEANWLREEIPALGGLTPFEALDDPTRRPDLIRLLNTMPSTPNTFNADRLRSALGLPTESDGSLS